MYSLSHASDATLTVNSYKLGEQLRSKGYMNFYLDHQHKARKPSERKKRASKKTLAKPASESFQNTATHAGFPAGEQSFTGAMQMKHVGVTPTAFYHTPLSMEQDDELITTTDQARPIQFAPDLTFEAAHQEDLSTSYMETELGWGFRYLANSAAGCLCLTDCYYTLEPRNIGSLTHTPGVLFHWTWSLSRSYFEGSVQFNSILVDNFTHGS